jgi:hypothetical protein
MTISSLSRKHDSINSNSGESCHCRSYRPLRSACKRCKSKSKPRTDSSCLERINFSISLVTASRYPPSWCGTTAQTTHFFITSSFAAHICNELTNAPLDTDGFWSTINYFMMLQRERMAGARYKYSLPVMFLVRELA